MHQPGAIEANLVEARMERGKEPHGARQEPRAADQVVTHGRPVNSLEHHPIGPDLVDDRHREPVGSRVRHDGCLTFRVATGSEHRAIAEVRDRRGSSLHRRHGAMGYRSTWMTRGGVQNGAVGVRRIIQLLWALVSLFAVSVAAGGHVGWPGLMSSRQSDGSGYRARGRSTVKVEPLPTTLSTVMSPPMPRASSRLIGSPRPTPRTA